MTLGGIIVVILIFCLLDRWDRSEPSGGGYRPRPFPRGVNRIRPPGAEADSPNVRYQMGGTKLPWDIRPDWLWNEMWALKELPYGVQWADELRAEIKRKFNVG